MRVNNDVCYVLKDYLGSASVVTDSTGAIVGEQQYYPYGGMRLTSGSMYTDKLFTGQREMAGLGIYHYNARFYSATLGRFLSADTIVPGAADPQAFNRYAYVVNNPLRYVDPTGHNLSCAGGLICHGPGIPEWRPPPPPPHVWGGGQPSEIVEPAPLVAPIALPATGSVGSSGQTEPLPGHQYDVGPHPVCLNLPWIQCTDSETQDYLARWQYPGQFFWQPVQNDHDYYVAPERIGGVPTPIGALWPGSGAINVVFDDHSITNVAYPTHVFYEGYVERTWVRDENGTPFVTTHGEGTNDGFTIIETPIFSFGLQGFAVDYVNQAIGPLAFDLLDAGLLTYTTVVETGQYLSGLSP